MVCQGMLAPRKFMQRRKKIEVFENEADEEDQKNWRKMMNEIDEVGSAVSVLRTRRTKNQPLPKDLVLGTLVRFKQQKKWNIVAEVYNLLPFVLDFHSMIALCSYNVVRKNQFRLSVAKWGAG